MTRYFTLLIIAVCSIACANAQVKIGSLGAPNANAVLELDGGVNKGLLLPKLNSTQIAALTTAPDGLFVYNITDGFLYLRKAGAWQKITDATTGGGGLMLPYAGSVATTAGNNAFKVQNTTGIGIAGESLGSYYGVTGYSASGAGGFFTSGSGPALITGTGNVGIGTPLLSPPAFPLDVTGRVRLRNKSSETPGIWFEKISTPSEQSSFLGILNDSIMGIYGTKANQWKFFFNHDNNNFGIYNSNPRAPLSFAAANGNKLDLYYESPTAMYGMGIGSAELQLYNANVGAHTSFGYGASAAFTETFRINNNGITVNTNPSSILTLRTSGTVFKIGNSFTGAIKTLGTSATTARLGLYGHVSQTEGDLVEYLSINDDGKVGLNNIFPTNPLSFPATLEKKISLYPGATGDVGLGVSGNELRIYSDNSNAVTTIGYDNFTNGFTENFRVTPDGSTVVTNPTTLASNVQNATYFKSGSYYTGAIKSIGTASNSARLGLFAFSTLVQNNLKEYMSITDGGNVGMNVIAPNSRLQVNGSVSMPIRNISADYTATDDDYSIHCIDGSNTQYTVTLPSPSGRTGRTYILSSEYTQQNGGSGISFIRMVYIKYNGNNNVFDDNPAYVDFDGSQYHGLMNFKPFGSTVVKRKLNMTLQSDGTKWVIVAANF